MRRPRRPLPAIAEGPPQLPAQDLEEAGGAMDDNAEDKAKAGKLVSYLRYVWWTLCVIAFFCLVSATCMVMITISLYSDSETLTLVATQGKAIMDTVQLQLTDFQNTQILSTVKSVSDGWTASYSPTMNSLISTITNTLQVVDAVLVKVVAGNTTALVDISLAEVNQFVVAAQQVLAKLEDLFGLSSSTINQITAGT